MTAEKVDFFQVTNWPFSSRVPEKQNQKLLIFFERKLIMFLLPVRGDERVIRSCGWIEDERDRSASPQQQPPPSLWSTSSSSPSLSSSLIGTFQGYHMILSLVGNCSPLRSFSKGSRSVKHKIKATFSQVTSALCSSCRWWGCQESSLTRRRRRGRRWEPGWWPRWWARPEILTPVLTNHVY